MAKTVRLNDKEEAALIKLQLKINKELVRMNMATLQDTDIFHIIMEKTIIDEKVEINRKGEILIIN